MRIEHSMAVDFDKYHTFFLEYWNERDPYRSHCVRPCTATYDEIESHVKQVYTLEGSVISFSNETTLSEIMIHCSLIGIRVDFVDIYANTEEYENNRWSDRSSKVIQSIDTHKEDVSQYVDVVNAPKFYIARNKNRDDALKFLVINRFLQDHKVRFMDGKYENSAIIAGFHKHYDATVYCEKLNSKKI